MEVVGRAVLLLLALGACDVAEERRAFAIRPSPSPVLRLSNVSVPVEPFHLDGMAEDARFIEDTATGSYEVLPGLEVEAGTRLELRGEGCVDADSVHVVLQRWEPGPHDRKQEWVATRRFPAGADGWSGALRLPRRPGLGRYAVTAVCELGGHAYFPSGWDIRVRPAA